MGSGAAARAIGAGGAAISPLRPSRAYLIAVASTLAVALVLAIYPELGQPRLGALLVVGGVAVVLLGAGIMLGSAIVVTGGVALLGCEFLVSLYARDTTAGFTAAAYGAGLLLLSELAYLALDLGLRHRGGGDVLRRRAMAIAALVAASLAAALTAAAISQATIPGSLALTVIGISGVLAAIAMVAIVLQRPAPK